MGNRPFRADHVGSMIQPARLLDARQAYKQGVLGGEALRRVEDDCIREAVKLQENLGFRAVTDGEMRRSHFSRDFLLSLDNVKLAEGRLEIYFKTAEGTSTNVKPNSIKVTGKLRRSKAIQLADFEFLKSVTRTMPKVCIPSPTLMHFRGGRDHIDSDAYPTMEDFFADLADAYCKEIDDLTSHGLKYLQIDDPNLAYLCDERFREAARRIGEDPDKLPQVYARLINNSLRTVPKGVTVAIHLCRGNASTGGAASGGYEPVAETLFSELHVDGFFLEYDDERSGDFAPLRFVPKGKTVVLGLVTTKQARLESKDELKARIDRAAKVMPLEQLAISPQCGFSSAHVSVDDQTRKLARIVETAEEVWGSL